MDRLETLLHDTLTDRAEQAPAGPVRLDVPGSRTRRVTVAIVAASAVVILLAVGIAALNGFGGNTPSTAPHHQHGRLLPTPASLPAGVRLASFGAVSLQVPAGLRTATSLCGRAVENEVVALDDASQLCPVVAHRLSAHPGTVVWLSSYNQHTPYDSIPTSPARLAGQRVQRGYATNFPDLGAGVSVLVKLPSQRATVGITAPTRAAVDHLLNSMRISRSNPLGCADRRASAARLSHGPTSVIVPHDVDAAVRCEYSSTGPDPGTLIGSYRLDRADTVSLARALNRLRPDPCHCVHGGTPAPGHTEIVYFHDNDGWTLRITGTVGSNLDTYTNGSRTVANYNGTVASLLAKLTQQT